MFTCSKERKNTKNSAKSAAFQAKKDAVFAEAAQDAGNAVKQGITYMSVLILRIYPLIYSNTVFSEQYRSKISELKVREVSQDQYLQDLALFGTKEVLFLVYAPDLVVVTYISNSRRLCRRFLPTSLPFLMIFLIVELKL